MKKVRSIKVNAMLNIMKTVISIGIHLITIPYASRVLGASHYGGNSPFILLFGTSAAG